MNPRLMRIETEYSTYEIDERQQIVTRLPDVRSLRQDGVPLPYLAMGEPTVGEELKMVVVLRADGAPTYRRTSTVTRVEVACAWCDTYNMDEMKCPNAKDICTDCCGED